MRKSTANQVLERDDLENVAQAGSDGKPHVLEVGRGAFVLGVCGTQAADLGKGPVEGANHVGLNRPGIGDCSFP